MHQSTTVAAVKESADQDPMAVKSNQSRVELLDCRGRYGFEGHELVASCSEPESGLEAIIAIHSTRLGPSLGGCRMWPYSSREEAVTDALRLSQAMSFKHAVAGTRQGGGKAVIIGDPRSDKTDKLFRAFGRFVDELGGRYVTAEDVGTTVENIVAMREHTDHVAGLPIEFGGSGDPSPMTAFGVYCGIQAAVAFRQGRAYDPQHRLDGVRVAIQGLGNVGYEVARYLYRAGARLTVTDIDAALVRRAVDEFAADRVDPDSIYDVDADVFSPCALGATLNVGTAPRLTASIVAGAANNQLADRDIAALLTARGILYAPDYVINAGGVINISHESEGYRREQAARQTEQIGHTLSTIFSQAAVNQRDTAEVADSLARQALITR